MRNGVRLGVDVGSVRIGVARCDPGGVLAVPAETVARGRGDLERLAELVTETEAIEVVVGLPRTLAGRDGAAAQAVRLFVDLLARRVAPVPVRLVDERLSTVSAQAGYRSAGLTTRQTRARIDQAAAAVILQSALDVERGSGAPAGELVPAGRDDRTEPPR